MPADTFVASQGKLNVLSFPAEDAVLRKYVRDALEDVTERDAHSASDALRVRLRVVYPRAEVRVRDPLAGYGEPILYVFRDGGIGSTLGSEAWIEDSAAARVVTDASGIYVEANRAAAELFGVRRGEIVGRPAGTFTEPEALIVNPQDLWAKVETTGALHSLAVVRRPDGLVRVEFITRRNADGPGRHVTWLRPYG